MIRFDERSLGAHYGLPLPGPRELELFPPAPPEPAPPEPFPWVRRDVDHWLYWFYDAEGTLLYVGITNSGRQADGAARSGEALVAEGLAHRGRSLPDPR
jgi:hypothetical protein